MQRQRSCSPWPARRRRRDRGEGVAGQPGRVPGRDRRAVAARSALASARKRFPARPEPLTALARPGRPEFRRRLLALIEEDIAAATELGALDILNNGLVAATRLSRRPPEGGRQGFAARAARAAASADRRAARLKDFGKALGRERAWRSWPTPAVPRARPARDPGLAIPEGLPVSYCRPPGPGRRGARLTGQDDQDDEEEEEAEAPVPLPRRKPSRQRVDPAPAPRRGHHGAARRTAAGRRR